MTFCHKMCLEAYLKLVIASVSTICIISHNIATAIASLSSSVTHIVY